MDTEDFLLKRRALQERMDERRAKDRSSFPFRIGDAFGFKLPSLIRWTLSFLPLGGFVSNLMSLGLPLAIPFFFKKKPPLVSRLLSRFFPSKS